ncbi:NAD(P)/FAD-dependent oxidoreductase [Paenibacillus elgii]|uniref:NAD(P)/FAD-dependent oxidoreductase n=1 Tax=Paenibacillus elgii TaxID=189691 RepID=UPI000FDB1C31|nr:FAD-dependent monooxygenase [Paenibacillus elgii]NEN85015.1 FAD-dependent oxidoreductase [Paenibacillus elgii]
MQRIRDMVVIGAGISGSSMAKVLADRGWDVILIDGNRFPRHKVCGEFLSPESQVMLRSLGFQETVESLQPAKIHQARIILSEGDTLDIPLPGTALGISRFALDTTLHQSVIGSGVEMITGQKVASVTPADHGYRIETRQGGEEFSFRSRAVIAAWGGQGVPKVLDQRSPDSRYIGVKSHYTGIDLGPVVELYFFPGGYLGLSPVEDGKLNVAALLKKNTFQNKEKTVVDWIYAAGRRNPKLKAILDKVVPVPGTQAAVAPVQLNHIWSAWDRFPLVGDAAVMVPPLCGDGMSMALRSACLCAPFADRYLRGESSVNRWKWEYTRSLKREFNSPLRWGLLLQWMFSLPVFPRLMLSIAQSFPVLPASLIRATRLRESDL